MSQDPGKQHTKVNLAELAAGDGWDVVQTWNRPALELLGNEIGVHGVTTFPTKDDLLDAITARVAEHQRATVQEPATAAPVAKVYRVVGPHTVLGTKPGKTFADVLPPDQETALVEGGHIKIEKERA